MVLKGVLNKNKMSKLKFDHGEIGEDEGAVTGKFGRRPRGGKNKVEN